MRSRRQYTIKIECVGATRLIYLVLVSHTSQLQCESVCKNWTTKPFVWRFFRMITICQDYQVNRSFWLANRRRGKKFLIFSPLFCVMGVSLITLENKLLQHQQCDCLGTTRWDRSAACTAMGYIIFIDYFLKRNTY